MFHMGLACNMLTTVNGTPEINTQAVIPKYPGALPGGVRPWLRVALTGLTKQTGKLVDVTSNTDLVTLDPRITHIRLPDGKIKRIGFA
jgi:Ferritin-like